MTYSTHAGIDYVRTGSSGKDKQQVADRFGLTLGIVPDFVIHKGGALRAFLECKSINDGGTARDKASRYSDYRREAAKHGGLPVVAILNGKGWERVGDALDQVVLADHDRVGHFQVVHRNLSSADRFATGR